MIKKYRAGTFTEAFQRIKEELGPDAVILQQQELKNSKNPNEKVEVTVTLDDIAEAPPPPGRRGTEKLAIYNNKGVKPVEWRNLDRPPLPPKNVAPEPVKVNNDRLIDCMESTLAEVRKLREDFAATRNDFLEGVRVVRDRIPKEFNSITAKLTKSGLSAQIVQDLLAEVMLLCPANSRDEVSIREQMKKALANRISIAPRPRLRKGRPLVQMFIGPTGSGKSGIISKLAGRATITGNPNVAIVTTDCCRMGAMEQMEAFAAAADITLERAYSPEEIPEIFERLRNKSLVLVDTAGRSLGNKEHEEEVKAFHDAIRPDEMHVVLPLNMRDSDLKKSTEVYAALKANRVIFTKQDEASEQGALLWLPIKFEIPLSYIGNGQGPDNIVSAEKEIIAEWLVK
ncbi:MAG: 50S ribosome-binding GTPase [Fibromonadaceae bacterium]|jgi:flagellar biosynthesis protein FlhF|nr:50S ribosome-binding GTPase [Fibromonadaceae bacterium]